MRIVQVLLDQRIGGAERLAETLTDTWNSDGEEVRVVYLDARGPSSPLRRAVRLARELRRFRADLVIAHSALPNLFARLCAPPGVAVVSVLHSATDDFEDSRLRFAERILSRRGVVVAVSAPQAATYSSRFPGRSVVVIPNGVRVNVRKKTAVTLRPCRVVSVARVASQKRPEVWQEIAKILKNRDPNFDLTWVGPVVEPDMLDLVRRHREEGQPGTFADATPDVGPALCAADIFLHTSDREANSIGLLEAAAVGLPIVCSRELESVIPDGLIVTFFNTPSDAAFQILKLVTRWHDAIDDAQRNAILVRQRFSPVECAAAYKRLVSGIRG